MDYHQKLSIAANWAAILTAISVVGATLWLWCEQCSRRKKLENYLRDQKKNNSGKGQKSLMHLIRNLSMTEAEIMHAAFRSKKVEPRTKEGNGGLAETLLFEYTGQ